MKMWLQSSNLLTAINLQSCFKTAETNIYDRYSPQKVQYLTLYRNSTDRLDDDTRLPWAKSKRIGSLSPQNQKAFNRAIFLTRGEKVDTDRKRVTDLLDRDSFYAIEFRLEFLRFKSEIFHGTFNARWTAAL